MGCIPSKPPPEPTATSNNKAPAPKSDEAPAVSNTQHIPEVTLHEATPTHSRRSAEQPKPDEKKVKDTSVANPDGSGSGAGTGAAAAGAVATGGAAAAAESSGGGGGGGGDGGGGD